MKQIIKRILAIVILLYNANIYRTLAIAMAGKNNPFDTSPTALPFDSWEPVRILMIVISSIHLILALLVMINFKFAIKLVMVFSTVVIMMIVIQMTVFEGYLPLIFLLFYQSLQLLLHSFYYKERTKQ